MVSPRFVSGTFREDGRSGGTFREDGRSGGAFNGRRGLRVEFAFPGRVLCPSVLVLTL